MTDETPAAELNPAQRQAVDHREGPLMVIAGPGSGKTRVMTSRIANLIAHRVPAPAILAITFTNKAADEMRERALGLLGDGPLHESETPIISTFHAFCARLLRRWIHNIEPYQNSFSIYDQVDQRSVVEQVLEELGLDRSSFSPNVCLSHISRLKNEMVSPEEAHDIGSTHRLRQLARVFQGYHHALQQRNALDFDDLLLLTVQLLRESERARESCRFLHRYVLIDEFQDTNRPQYIIARLLAEEHRNLCVTGDPDQSIYSWRGASPENFDHFMEDFPEHRVVSLDENYRSTPEIVDVASRLTLGLGERRELHTRNAPGDDVLVKQIVNEREEARAIAEQAMRWRSDGTPFDEIAVLYRTNSLSRSIEEELTRQQLPYTVLAGIGFYQRKEVKDILAYLRAAALPRDELALRRIINTPNRGLGQVTVDRITDLARARHLTLGEALDLDEVRDAVPARARKTVRDFHQILTELREMRSEPLPNQVQAAIEKSGYIPYLERTEPESWRDRELNLEELISAAAETEELLAATPLRRGEDGEPVPRDPLLIFLERVTLATDMDRWEDREDRMALLTLHAAKGLEFDRVIIAGVEETLLPHSRAGEESDEDEERRLLYVGITRARHSAMLTHTAWRRRFQRREPAVPSRFIRELEGESIVLEHAQITTPAPTRDRGDFFGDTSDIGFDDDVIDEFAELHPGVWLEHDMLGRGVITATSGFGESKRVTVRFEDHGEKQLVASYAPFRIIGGPGE